MARNVRALAVALLCVLAVALGASTLAAPESPAGDGAGAGGPGTPQDGGSPPSSESGGDADVERAESSGRGTRALSGTCVPFLRTPAFLALAAASVVAAFAVAARLADRGVASMAVGAAVLTLLPLWWVFTDCRSSVDPSKPGGMPAFPELNATADGGGGGAASAADQLLATPVLLGALVAVAVVVAAIAYYASGGEPADGDGDEDEPGSADSGPEADSLTAAGVRAGDAADRIEDAADLENEVYRAWSELAAAVDADRLAASTPAEFAAAARETGMGDEHVEALTGLFRDVRYGGFDATPEREQRAVDALRAIQDEYAGDTNRDAEAGDTDRDAYAGETT
ncbi:MAG: DUF4129 domain-containing protein [Halobacterium sp.]